jgi:hypothetical protein
MKPLPDAQKYIDGFAYQPTQGKPPVRIPTENVVFFRTVNPFDYHRGLSPRNAYGTPMETDVSASRWNRETFDKGMKLQSIITLPQETSDPDFRMVREDIQNQLDADLRYLIARAGDLKHVPLGLSQKEAEYLAGRTFSREEIDTVFGIPAGFWSKEATRANSEAAKASLIENTVWPDLEMVAEDINAQCIKPVYGEQFEGQFEDIRPRDRALLVAERRQYWQVKTVNEARAELQLDPIDGDLGEQLVPLAIRQQRPGGVFPAQAEEPVEQMTKAARDDLRKWRSVALRRLREGNDPAGYEFESDVIPATAKAQLQIALTSASTEEEVKAAFAAGFQGSDQADHADHLHTWEGYP